MRSKKIQESTRVEPAIVILLFTKECNEAKGVKTSVKTMWNGPFASFLCQTAESCKLSYF